MSVEGKNMISNFHRVLDPLDIEILERAFDEFWAVFKEGETALECDCDQALDAALRRELTEIARLYGVTEPDTLRVVLPCIFERFLSMSASDQG
jgi:hypothetical protein